jgi:hypothetical protein
MTINMHKIVIVCVLFISVVYSATYFTVVYNINARASKSVILVKNKNEVVKELVYMSQAKGKSLYNYNISFLTMAVFLEKNTKNLDKSLYQIKLSSLKTCKNKGVEQKINLLKQQTNDVLISLMALQGVKNKVSLDSELIDAYIINQTIDKKNYKKEVKKLFKQLSIVFGKL